MASISIYDENSDRLWKNVISAEDFERLKTVTLTCNKNSGLVQSILMPVQTHSVKRFAQDFFLPIFANGCVYNRRMDRKGKVSEFVAGIALDTCTFPIRLTTAIPKILWNALRSENPLVTYMRENGAPPNVLRKHRVYVKLKGPIETLRLPVIGMFSGRPIAEYTVNNTYPLVKRTVNLKAKELFYLSRNVIIEVDKHPAKNTPQQEKERVDANAFNQRVYEDALRSSTTSEDSSSKTSS